MKGSFKFIHCADLHLGTKFVGVSTNDEALGKKMRTSTFKALNKIVDVAQKEKVNFVIFSGDIFDSSNETPLTRNMFAEALEKIKVPCYISYGNHDYKRRWEDSIPLPDNAFVFPDTVTKVMYPDEKNPLTEIIGISMSAQHTTDDLTSDIECDNDLFSIAVVHCDLDSVSEGSRYSPCKLSSLVRKNIKYWALGHIHKRCIVNERPYVVYPGNTQGKSPKESGEKGAYLVTVSDGIVLDMEFFRTGEILWLDRELDITGKENIKDLLKDLDGIEKGSFVKITVVGRGTLDNMARTDTDGFIELIESKTGCVITGIDIHSLPDIDLDARLNTGDFISAAIGYGKRLENEKRENLIDMICCTTTSQNIRSKYEQMTDNELRDIVRDAMLLVVEKMMGAESK